LETEMLVRVHGCGLCGSDILKIVERRYIFKMQENEHGKYTL
jgi:threonine dehydrogenase-like Zn-dependent dehydrogenase